MSLHQLVIDAAARPDAPAVGGPSGGLSYGELDALSNALATRLNADGLRRGDRAVVWAGKSAATVAAMQAVLRIGAAYVPADGSVPVGRVAAIARDCGARVVVTDRGRIPRISAELGTAAGYTDLGAPADPAPRPVNEPVAPDDLAYILYTSGSTGRPKGVCITHRNARAFIDWAYDELAPAPQDRFANHAPFTFDLSVLDLYVAFRAGASVHLIPPELSFAPMQLVEFLYRQRITHWYSVPSALALMMRHGLLDRPAPAALRAVLFAGEPFPIAQLRDLAGWTSARLMNLYGPTETNVCTFHEVTPADLDRDRPVPIGVAAGGDRVWARRPDGGVAEPGEEGELLVEGPTVMRGYWGLPPQRGPYGTGDRVRVLPDGSFDYLGRGDQMVKIRGHRIELGEVEHVLEKHADVAEAAVVAVGEGVDIRLVAFVAPHPGREIGTLALRRHVVRHLPRYMVADEVRLLAQLPRNGNGKVDRPVLARRAARSDQAVSQAT
ncbi:amino acid adenylation domain-containing protein [Actinomadura mexicana]|uniref:L-prolyl-[peptidyl carrier protein] synthetase n=1 Tax=Actinomadura mexicana TaxID=134959 RepID=A0A238XNZ8_9ACTN|nr:amino acid adenylation domain-containing protein [Actinomadura mexicana]SNR59729.1 L-prolyl-[peptidyl carrier protein] synthetase [Actinomadura mexicana]